jgi:tetratricopeptide (TPR) repeat protein
MIKQFGRIVVVLATSAGMAAAAAAQTSRTPAAGAPGSGQLAEAYHQFLLGSFLESEDNLDGAVAALRKALELDPQAAGAAAELADLYVRMNRADDAIRAAEQALSIDSTNVSAHQTLGFVYAGRVDRADQQSRGSANEDDDAARAIDHLEQAIADSDVQTDPNVRATLARLYVRGHSFEKAIPLLTTLVAQEPGWRQGPELLLEAFLGAGRSDDAIEWLVANAPNDPNLYPVLGDLYDRAHRWQDAADAYAEAIKVAPRNVELHTRYASSLMNAGGHDQLGKARDTLADALAIQPNDTQVLYLLSEAERRLGDLGGAETAARNLIAQDADSPFGYYALAQALEERGMYAAIVEALAPAADRFRKDGSDSSRELSMLLPHLGFAYQQTKQLDKAIATFEEARTLAPRDESLLADLVQANLAAKRYAQAVSLAHEARADRPDDLRLAQLEAQALVDGGKANQGVKLLEDFVGGHGGDSRAYVALSGVYEDAKRDADAVRVLRDAEARFPTDTTIPFELGATLERQKQYDAAETAFRKTIELDPNHAPALNYLGYMLAERGVRLDESVGYLKRALAIEPDNGAYLDSIGWAYFKADNLPLAEDNLRRAADQLRTNSVIQDHYGDVLDKLDRYADAINAWTRALDGDGESIDRRDIEKKIRTARQKLGDRR